MKEKFGVVVLAVALSSLAVPSAFAGPKLCPPPPPLKEGQDDMRMNEEDFDFKDFASSLSFLHKEIPKRLLDKDSKAVQRRLDSSEFWIGYRNSLLVIEGYALKQAALLQIAQTQLSPKTKPRDDAVKRFCEFVGSSHYAD